MTAHERTQLENEVLAALAHHQRWREHIRTSTDLTPTAAATVASLPLCPITTWLERRMPASLRATDLYARTLAAHRAFHDCVDLVAAGRSDGTSPAAAMRLKSYLDEWLSLSRTD